MAAAPLEGKQSIKQNELSDSLIISQDNIDVSPESNSEINPKVNVNPKRKLKDRESPDKPKLKSQLTMIVSPDGTIVVSPEHKKRLVTGNNTTDNNSDSFKHDKSSSENYDTEDNIPLSQYGSTTFTDSDQVFTPRARPQRTTILKRAIQNRTKRRAKNRDQSLDRKKYGAPNVNFSTDGDTSEKEKHKEKSNGNMLCILADIQSRITKMETDNIAAQKKLDGIGEDVKGLTTNGICKQDLDTAVNNLALSIGKDIEGHEKRIAQNENQLHTLTRGINATGVDLAKMKKTCQQTEESILNFKEEVEREKESLNGKIKVLQQSLEKMNLEKPKERPTENVNVTTTKNLMFEGLTEKKGEDVYDVVIRTVKELDIIIYDNDIDIAYMVGRYKGENTWPRPIRVKFISEHVRTVIWQHKQRLLVL